MPRCHTEVKDTMEKWSQKSWFNMLVNSGKFEAEFNECNEHISNCLRMFSVSIDGLKGACFEQRLDRCPNPRVDKPERRRKVEEKVRTLTV